MLKRLDHVNVRTAQLEKMIDWYVNVLGMENGYRPHFPFPGAWLYLGDKPVVHLVDVADAGVGAESELKLEHFAFRASDQGGFEDMLKKHQVPYRCGRVEDVNITQYNLWDPDGNHIHVDFSSEPETPDD